MTRTARRGLAAALALALGAAATAAAQAPQPFGSIDFVEGNATVTRGNRLLGDANIGDEVYPDDLIRTAGDGIVVIALGRATGMRGTLTVRPRSVAYLRLAPGDGGPRGGIELIAGQIASKMNKIAGNPSFVVTTETAVMGVRGTAFGVAASVNGGILITCSEGEVEARDGQTRVAVPAGNAAERKPSERLRVIPIRLSSPEEFERRWIADEIEAFRASPTRALADLVERYTELNRRFAEAMDPMQRSEILNKWLREDAAGQVPRSNDPAVMREKREIIGLILEARKVLFIFERIYYRLDQIEGLVLGTPAERAMIRPGLSAGDFLRRFRQEAPTLERRMLLFRQAERLYSLRNQDGAGFSGLGGSDDFFGSDEGWDF